VADSVKSAVRVIEIIHFFEEERQPSTLKRLCEALGYPQSSTTALLKTLTAMGYLSYNISDRTYFPTLRVDALGHWIPTAVFGSGQIINALRALHDATNETIVIATKNDIYVQYIATAISTHSIRHYVEEGSMRLMTTTVLGWLLMSKLKDSEVDNIIRRCNIAAGLPVSSNVQDILTHVKIARERGYGYGENSPVVGGATLGVVLPTTIQGQPVVLGCGGVLERVRENKQSYLSSLKKVSSEFGASLPRQ
jgi:DNA-binding IclR family transcriptional regulator